MEGEAQQIASFLSRLESRGLEKKAQEISAERLAVAALLPSQISSVLALVHETGVRMQECTSSAQVVTTAQDRLAVIEHSLLWKAWLARASAPDA